MVAEISYSTVSDVVNSWESLRRIKNYEEIAGVMLFRKFFEMEPSARTVFSFCPNAVLTDDFFKSDRLVKHAKYFIAMVDRAIGLLGPDIELLTDILLELGEKHVKFGVKATYYPLMGEALIATLEEILGNKFTPAVKASWYEIYQGLSYDMIRGQKLLPEYY